MNRIQFKQLTDEIGENFLHLFNVQLFEAWFKRLEEEEFEDVKKATNLLLENEKKFPSFSVMADCLKQVKTQRKSKEEKEKRYDVYHPLSDEELKLQGYCTREESQRWIRFIRYTLETHVYPKTSEEAFQMKKLFEEKYPPNGFGWQSKPLKKQKGLATIGEALSESFL